MNLCVAGAAGAFGRKHLDALARIDGVRVVSVVGGPRDDIAGFAAARGIPHATRDLDEALARGDVDAVILATPTPLHAEQAMRCLRAGRPVLVEIPMADRLADAEALVGAQRETGLVAMAGHVRRFNPGHQWIHRRLSSGDLRLLHLEAQTHFLRRRNLNALGEPRDWTDHLLWHHACHTVDLFRYQTGETPERLHILAGPPHPELGIAMDMSIGLKTPSGALCSLALSFNDDGPPGTVFRYICDRGTYTARYDDLEDGHGRPIDLSGIAESRDGLELIDRAFVAALRGGGEPDASVAQCLPAMRTLDALARRLDTPEP